MQKKIKIAPSLLSANFANLSEDLKKCAEGKADLIHVDVMDGHFVPNITIGPVVVKAIRSVTDIPLACHLMITDPEKYIEKFVKAGADLISVHVEGLIHIHRTVSLIKSLNKKAGIALNPATPLEFAFDSAENCDYILLMSVNPGFGGQKFIPSFLRRAERLKEFLVKNNLDHIEIEVDGGVNFENVADIVHAGATVLASGSVMFEGNLAENIIRMRELAESAYSEYGTKPESLF